MIAAAYLSALMMPPMAERWSDLRRSITDKFVSSSSAPTGQKVPSGLVASPLPASDHL